MTMNNNEILDQDAWTASTVRSLVDSSSFDILVHRHRTGESMPSTKKLRTIVERVRQIIFPGFFGEINLKSDTLSYYMGVLVDEVYEMISDQIFVFHFPFSTLKFLFF